MVRSSVSLIAVLGLFVAAALAAENVKLEGIKCPVAGNKPAKAENSVAYKKGKVYFCCGNCPKAFSENTAKYAARANHQLVATGQAVQSNCPFSGGEMDGGINTVVAGAKIAFCSDNCKERAEKAKGDEQVELLFNDKTFEKAGFKVTPAK